jgi:hypothetical protein
MVDNKPVLAQAFTPEEMQHWGNIVQSVERTHRSISGSKIPGRSNTPQDILKALKSASEKGENETLFGRLWKAALRRDVEGRRSGQRGLARSGTRQDLCHESLESRVNHQLKRLTMFAPIAHPQHSTKYPTVPDLPRADIGQHFARGRHGRAWQLVEGRRSVFQWAVSWGRQRISRAAGAFSFLVENPNRDFASSCEPKFSCRTAG